MSNACKTGLRGANLQEKDLPWAYLRWADVRGANLRQADVREAPTPNNVSK
ncbi:MAG: pentapeptide repeat-containing protein [Phycisphaerales bacterium]|jgi:uncharacterized protein YjbI with pentapeptide repeats